MRFSQGQEWTMRWRSRRGARETVGAQGSKVQRGHDSQTPLTRPGG